MFHRLPVHLGRHGVHEKARPVGDEVQPPQDMDRPGRDGKLLPRLPQGTLLRHLVPLRPASGKADLPRLAVHGLCPHLVQQGQALIPLHQGD